MGEIVTDTSTIHGVAWSSRFPDSGGSARELLASMWKPLIVSHGVSPPTTSHCTGGDSESLPMSFNKSVFVCDTGAVVVLVSITVSSVETCVIEYGCVGVTQPSSYGTSPRMGSLATPSAMAYRAI